MESLVCFRFWLTTGFFRLEPYFISIGSSQVHLDPQENGKRIRIPHERLRSIILYSAVRELEIVTSEEVFVGRLDNTCSIDMLMSTLCLAFDSQMLFKPS